MTRALASLVALCCLAASSPIRAGEPCRRVVHLDTGALAPCRGDLYPVLEAQRLLDAEDELAAERERLALLARERAADAALAAKLLDSEREARRACEAAQAPPPQKPRPSPPAVYERASFWAGLALTTAAVTVAIAVDDHPLLWAASGAGLGVMIGGSF